MLTFSQSDLESHLSEFERQMRTNRIALACTVFLMGGVLAQSASADAMYGLSSSTPGTVYTIDTNTGAATAVVNLTGVTQTSLVDVSFLNGTLYADDVFQNGAFRFGSIDLTTGAFTAINNQGGSANWHSLAAVASANLLYAVDLNSAGENLVSVTAGGTISTIGTTNHSILDLAYDANHDILYGVDNTSLYTINRSTGASTLVGTLGITKDSRPGLGYDNNDNTLYLNVGDTGTFYSVNTGTGLATVIGSNGPTNGFGIDGLADVAATTGVPEPGAILPLVPLVIFAVRRRRREA